MMYTNNGHTRISTHTHFTSFYGHSNMQGSVRSMPPWLQPLVLGQEIYYITNI